MRNGDRRRVDQQNEVEKRDLVAKCVELRAHEFGVAFSDRQRIPELG
jgi:hypothetical protein